jgi:hypothetical protein
MVELASSGELDDRGLWGRRRGAPQRDGESVLRSLGGRSLTGKELEWWQQIGGVRRR